MRRPEQWFELAPRWSIWGRVAAGLFCVPFLAGGLGALYGLALLPVDRWSQARFWRECPAVVIESRLAEIADSDGGDAYRVEARYRYRFEGRSYTGDRFNFTSVSTNMGVPAMRDAVQRLPAGTETICWVNPAAPGESVLDRSWPPGTVIGFFFSLPFLLIGAVGSGGALLGPRLARAIRARRTAWLESLISQGALPWPTRLAPDAWDRQHTAIILSRDRHLVTALGASAICLFWNGIVSVFVVVFISEWIVGGRFGTYLGLFLLPFIAVGLALLWTCLRTWRLAFRPAWVALVSPLPGKEGGEVRVALAVAGPAPLRAAPPRPMSLVAVEMPIDSESGKPTMPSNRFTGIRRKPGKRNQNKGELARVELTLEFPRGSTTVRLPALVKSTGGIGSRAVLWWLEMEDERGLVESHVVSQEDAPP